ncbi:LexA family transcriptional regulator [Streptococcus sp. 10F2]
MNILGESIKIIRKSKKLTQSQLAELTGFKQNTISNHENGKRQLDERDIRIYAQALGVEPQELFDLSSSSDDKSVLIDNHQEVESSTLKKITDTSSQLEHERQLIVLDTAEKQLQEQNTVQEDSTYYDSEKVTTLSKPKEEYEYLIVHGLESAGEGIWQEEDTDIEVRVPTSEIPDEFDDLAMVIGDSMRPKLHNGDILFITFTKQIEIGEIGVFRTSKGNFVKRLQSDRLESLNSDYDDIYFSEDEYAEAVGVVVDVYRK